MPLQPPTPKASATARLWHVIQAGRQDPAALDELHKALLLFANLDARSSFQATPLHRAAAAGLGEVVRILLAAHADYTAKDSDQETPLHEAAKHGHAAVAQALLQAGAYANARCNGLETPLHQAATRGHTAVVHVLTTAGADLHAANLQHRTPLHLAHRNQHPDAAIALLAAGADPLILDRSGAAADPGGQHTAALVAMPTTTPAVLDRLRIHALRHLGDQPAAAAHLLELIATRSNP